MKRKIVITGITSQIIKELALRIDFSKYEVIGITRHPEAIKLEEIKLIKGDIQNFEDISHLFENCYMIIHGAAITHSRREIAYYDINLHATQKIVEAAKQHNVERFIYISSNTAGKNSGTYSLTKLLAEQYIQKEISNWTIIRLSEIFGSSKNEGIDKLLSDVICKSLILCPTNMASKLCPIHINDAVNLMFIRIFNDKYINSISVVNGNQKFSYHEIIELAKQISNRKIKVILLNRRLMFFIKWIVKYCPINFGIVPDQIDRLYGKKDFESNKGSILNLREHLEQLMDTKQ